MITPRGPTENPLLFSECGVVVCAPKSRTPFDDDDNPSRPHRKSSFTFVGQTFLRCVSGRLSIGRRSRGLLLAKFIVENVTRAASINLGC